VAACDDDVLPFQERLERIDDEAGLEELSNTERHLRGVACTRARDNLLVTKSDLALSFSAHTLPGSDVRPSSQPGGLPMISRKVWLLGCSTCM
jgi:hypothetical protein